MRPLPFLILLSLPLFISTLSFFPTRRLPLTLSLTLRGGSDTYSSDEDDSTEFSLFDTDMDESYTSDLPARMISLYAETPPLTKLYCTSSLLVTLYSVAFNSNQYPSILDLDYAKVVMRLQIWRPLTAFLNYGPLGIGYLLTMQFVYTYMSSLERLSFRSPPDFWCTIAFGMLSMVLSYAFLQLPPRLLGHNLSTMLVYIWSRSHEGMEVAVMDLFMLKAEMLPWFFMMQVSRAKPVTSEASDERSQ